MILVPNERFLNDPFLNSKNSAISQANISGNTNMSKIQKLQVGN